MGLGIFGGTASTPNLKCSIADTSTSWMMESSFCYSWYGRKSIKWQLQENELFKWWNGTLEDTLRWRRTCWNKMFVMNAEVRFDIIENIKV